MAHKITISPDAEGSFRFPHKSSVRPVMVTFGKLPEGCEVRPTNINDTTITVSVFEAGGPFEGSFSTTFEVE